MSVTQETTPRQPRILERDHGSSAPTPWHRKAILRCVAGAGLQAALLGAVASILGAFLTLMIPMAATSAWAWYMAFLAVFALGSGVAGHMEPTQAFARSGLAFFCVFLLGISLQQNLETIFLDEETEFVHLAAVWAYGILGMAVCALSGTIGSRWHQGLRARLGAEWQAFMASLWADPTQGGATINEEETNFWQALP